MIMGIIDFKATKCKHLSLIHIYCIQQSPAGCVSGPLHPTKKAAALRRSRCGLFNVPAYGI